MNPLFSRRIAKAVQSLFFFDQPAGFKEKFIDRVSKVDSFNDLTDDDKDIVVKAEKMLKQGKSPWK